MLTTSWPYSARKGENALTQKNKLEKVCVTKIKNKSKKMIKFVSLERNKIS